MKKTTKIICFVLSLLIVSYIVHFFVDCWFAKQRLVRIFEKFEIIEKVSLSRANFYLTKHNDDFYDYCVRYSLSCTAIQNFKNYIVNSEIEPFVQGIDFPIDKEQEILSFELQNGPWGDTDFFNYSVYMNKESGKSIVIEVSKRQNTNKSPNLTHLMFYVFFIAAVVFFASGLEKLVNFCKFQLCHVRKK